MTVSLKFAQDVRNHFEIFGPNDILATVRGLVTKRKNKGRVQFIELLDVTGSIQILLLKENFSDEDYEEKCRKLARGNIISASGPVELSKGNGELSIVPTEPPEVLEIGSSFVLEEGADAFRSAGSRVVQARIIDRLESYFRQHDYLEIEPKILSTEWDGNGLEPLRAEFPGFGHNVFLVPSPLPQLFEALISTGAGSVFATGKCLSTSYRDVHSSTEAVSIFTVERIERPIRSDKRLYSVAMDSIAALLSSTGLALPSVTEMFNAKEPQIIQTEWTNFENPPEGLSIHIVKNPSIPVRLAEKAPSLLSDVAIDRYARIILNHDNQVYCLAECTAEVRFGALRVLTNTINTEHILSLLSTAPFRSLRTSTFWDE